MGIFLDKLNKKLDEIKRETDPKSFEIPTGQQLYSIYKRSLPLGVNKPVRMNLTLEDAKRAMVHLQTKTVNEVVVYYDIVAQLDERQKDPLFNEGPITKVDDRPFEERFVTGKDQYNDQWVG